MDGNIKRWTAKRKSALVIEIIQGKATVAEVSRSYDLAPSKIENWGDDARKGMENALHTNPIERLNKEVKRRADVAGIFPNEASIMRLIGAVLFEQSDEWQAASRYMMVEAFA
ncbi:transposase [Ruegeria pomeroyi]|nr:transposase [Ruegeria pomeroyi]